MAQAGIHALVGAALRKITPRRQVREWLMLGIVLGSLFPDLDNFAVAAVTLAKVQPAVPLHRTFTHGVLAAVLAAAVFAVVAWARKQPRWANLGVGLAVGIGLHAVLDLLLWYNGVELLWPFGGWVNLWQGVTPPDWFAKLLDPLEFLFIGLYFLWLAGHAWEHKTDAAFQRPLRVWTAAMALLLLIFTPLAYLLGKSYQTIYGLFYLIALTAAFAITIRMRRTVEAG